MLPTPTPHHTTPPPHMSPCASNKQPTCSAAVPQAQSAASATAASTAFTDAAANTPASPADAASLAGLAGFQACWTFLAGSRDSEAAAAANTKLPLLSLAIHGSQLLVDHATTSSSAPGPPAAVTEGQATLSRDLARQQQQQARDAQKSLLRAVCHKVAGDAALALVG